MMEMNNRNGMNHRDRLAAGRVIKAGLAMALWLLVVSSGFAADPAPLQVGAAKEGDLIVIVCGIPIGVPGGTNLLKVERV